ncbi:TIGR04255 family protein [Crenothrix sp.]|uniref:TIGR04255 family protein n=1 Tax=Crenothrix sp. TaxID=3100433 RepID=UPI00374C96F6
MQTSRSKKLSYRPINGAHAIVEVVFFVQFSPEFNQATRTKLASLEFDLKNDLPKAEQIKKVAFQFASGHHPSVQSSDEELLGVVLQGLKEDGSVEWMLRTTENTIAIHCLDYTTWAEVSTKAEGFLKKAFAHMGDSNSSLAVVGLKYVDKFICHDISDQPNLSELFKNDTPHVVKTAFYNDGLWHSNSGWFDKLDELQCLNQLNIDASFMDANENKPIEISIDHTVIAIIGNGNCSEPILELNLDFMSKLHLKNKKVLADLLTEDMQKRINLKP